MLGIHTNYVNSITISIKLQMKLLQVPIHVDIDCDWQKIQNRAFAASELH